LLRISFSEILAVYRASLGLFAGEKDVTPEDVYFRVIHPEGSYIFAAGDVRERLAWINDFREAISVYLQKLKQEEGEVRSGKHTYMSEVEKYRGCYLTGKREGQGELDYFNGALYKGEWTSDWENGTGVLAFYDKVIVPAPESDVTNQKSDSIFNSMNVFKRSKTMRPQGEGSNSSRDVDPLNPPESINRSVNPFLFYDGHFEHGFFKGFATISFATRDVYDGEIDRGEMHGTGKMTWGCGTEYVGKWFHGQMIEGTLTSADKKQVYEGKFENGKRHGKGTMKYRHGGKYEGNWVYDVKEGQGEYVDAEGSIYSGTWVKGKKAGGAMTYITGDVYKGEWKNDLREGRGEMKYANGTVYSGDWVAGRRQGRGVMTFMDGSEYSGPWESDYPHGHGTLTTRGGTKYDGIWKEGKLEGKSVVVTPDGVSYQGVVREGRFTCDELNSGTFAPIFPRFFSFDE
jgi:hypothetical protein